MRVSGVVWSFIQQGGRLGVSYLMFVVLALVLSPRDFGVVGMAAVWVAFIAIFAEIGLGVALIQRKALEPGHLSTAFAANLLLGVGLSALGVLLARPAAAFFRTPDVAPVLAALSLGFVLNALSLTQTALAQRELRFRDLAVRDIAASVIGGMTGVVLAFRGFGVWSLVAQTLVTSAAGAVLLWALSVWRPRLAEVSWARFAELWSVGADILLYNVFKYFVQNLDRLLIGYLLGPVALGAFTFASRLVLTPVAGFRGAVGAYLFPRLAMMQDDVGSLRAAYLFANKAMMAATAPAMAAVALLAPAIIPSLFGQRWTPAVPLVQLLAVVAVLQSLIAPVGELMKALGRMRLLLWWAIAFSGMIGVLVAAGSRWGAAGVVGGLAAAHAVGVLVNLRIAGALIAVRAGEVLEGLAPTLAASVLLAIFLAGGMSLPIYPEGARMALGLAAGLAAYVLVMTALDRPFLGSIVRRLVKV